MSHSIVALQLVVVCGWKESFFSLSSSDFSIPWSSFYGSELIYFCRTGFMTSAKLKYRYFTVIFSTFYDMYLFLQFIVKQGVNWRASSSRIWRRVVRRVSTDVLEEHIASIFRVEEINSACHLFACWILLNIFIWPWRWRRCVPPKFQLKLDGLHSVISQKMILFITTAVKTSNTTRGKSLRLDKG
jgi:hypothetical protein